MCLWTFLLETFSITIDISISAVEFIAFFYSLIKSIEDAFEISEPIFF